MHITIPKPSPLISRRVRRSAMMGAMLLTGSLALSGCGADSVQQLAGISRDGPDEFQVVRRAPLIIPPDYNLRPPGEEVAERQVTQNPSVGARQILIGSNRSQRDSMSPAERRLLSQSPVRADPDIRTEIARDDVQLSTLDSKRVLFVLDFQRRLYEPRPELIDPVAEAERLAAEGSNNILIERVGSVPIDQIGDTAEQTS